MKTPCGHLFQEVLPGARPDVLKSKILRMQGCSGRGIIGSGSRNRLDFEAAMFKHLVLGISLVGCLVDLGCFSLRVGCLCWYRVLGLGGYPFLQCLCLCVFYLLSGSCTEEVWIESLLVGSSTERIGVNLENSA